ncbi:MAG: hypothetical protein KIT09_33270 [Bryobacteraceae bacterium]|nr:hypothetical protein [Bryobacteraceae bacterium]
MPSINADYYGPKHVGANYGLVFTVWGIFGFLRLAANLAGGYSEVYLKLAVLALFGAALTEALRPPRRESKKDPDARQLPVGEASSPSSRQTSGSPR